MQIILTNMATMAAGLCVVAGLMLFGMGKLNDSQGGRGEAVMIGCFIAAAAFGAAAVYCGTIDFEIGI